MMRGETFVKLLIGSLIVLLIGRALGFPMTIAAFLASLSIAGVVVFFANLARKSK